MITEKTCKQCHETKHVRGFHKKSDMADGYYPICKDCRRQNEGHAKRATPKVRTEDQPITMQTLIEDILHLAHQYPTNVKFRQAAEEVRKNPEGPHSEFTASLLYEAWQNRQRQVHCFEELDETTPVLTLEREKRIRNRETAYIWSD